ncbi:PQQ-binding-like beta-propeller repeat protein [Blastopirellula sp. JC732]|uniref:PQQ-binding-like beta-propeller repeat protein n=1 Tax=Blastopirellula sediminis TaxID=2894196 RepID=A0A9X1MNL4_9BACT|nr:PQQ-binding-like beta-propeller repeat protein [Blastopirellula sediminis]MCC9606128.1 PQQ-binding-like beta-propeller repeat protein [Blastopirellula sediminis]MCC9630573.1 PQQ-binding-like beta-propeller repeat protein [Blastopirellula sediminis]
MRLFALLLALALPGVQLFAESAKPFDWPQWQGPNRDAISQESGLLQEWPKDGPALAWKASGLGGGDSTPSIAAGRIFAMSNRGKDEVVWALSEEDGKELWVTKLGPAYEQRMSQSNEGPGCTPTVDGDLLYVMGMKGNVACLKVEDGSIVWQRDLQADYKGAIPTWSFRESPLIDGEKVIFTPGGDEAMIVALNKKSGETIWESKLPASTEAPAQPPAEGAPRPERPRGEEGRPGGPGGFGGPGGPGGPGRGGRGGRGGFGGFGRGPGAGAAYASAIAIDVDGERQYVQFAAKTLFAVSSDGKPLWRYDHPANGMGINCSTPIYKDGLVFAASAYGTGGGAVKLEKKEDGTYEPEEVYFTSSMQNHHGGMIVHDGALYGGNGGNGGGFLACLDFQTGDVLWRERDAQKGSLTMAGDRLYLRTEDGDVILIEPNKEKYIEHGRFHQPDRTDKPAWAHPVVANGKLYIRDHDTMYVYDVKAK